jgi:hypothetical protein
VRGDEGEGGERERRKNLKAEGGEGSYSRRREEEVYASSC